MFVTIKNETDAYSSDLPDTGILWLEAADCLVIRVDKQTKGLYYFDAAEFKIFSEYFEGTEDKKPEVAKDKRIDEGVEKVSSKTMLTVIALLSNTDAAAEFIRNKENN